MEPLQRERKNNVGSSWARWARRGGAAVQGSHTRSYFCLRVDLFGKLHGLRENRHHLNELKMSEEVKKPSEMKRECYSFSTFPTNEREFKQIAVVAYWTDWAQDEIYGPLKRNEGQKEKQSKWNESRRWLGTFCRAISLILGNQTIAVRIYRK